MRFSALVAGVAALFSAASAQDNSAVQYSELVSKGFGQSQEGKFEEACGTFEKALAIFPNDGQFGSNTAARQVSSSAGTM